MQAEKDELPVLPEPVAWRGLTQSYPYPQDNDWRYGPWVYDLDPAKYKPLFTAFQMHAYAREAVARTVADVKASEAAKLREWLDLIATGNHWKVEDEMLAILRSYDAAIDRSLSGGEGGGNG